MLGIFLGVVILYVSVRLTVDSTQMYTNVSILVITVVATAVVLTKLSVIARKW